VPQSRLSIVAAFPKNYFLENLVIRADNSVLVTALNHKELWRLIPLTQVPLDVVSEAGRA